MQIDLTDEPVAGPQTHKPPQAPRDSVAARAYELYVARGQRAGSALEDWLQAESEIRGTDQRETVSVG